MVWLFDGKIFSTSFIATITQNSSSVLSIAFLLSTVFLSFPLVVQNFSGNGNQTKAKKNYSTGMQCRQCFMPFLTITEQGSR